MTHRMRAHGSFDTHWPTLTGANDDAEVSGHIRTIWTYLCPDMSKWLEEREEFWADVKAMLCKCDRSVRIVVLSDFNDWVGVGVQRDGCEEILGKFGDEKGEWVWRLSSPTVSRVRLACDKRYVRSQNDTLIFVGEKKRHEHDRLYNWEWSVEKHSYESVPQQRWHGRLLSG
ncbi:hypothetical protein EVAR_90744_1 [Eumeta japonica]|uniref:Uncharacterized protein n=1 Tax=Eumeta variegata TaxID=151549 RepID=A0A4C1Z8J6_EUMVA|nr:hypothetical protein EVAR_90744_1 [Eumeta japonica]